MSLIPYHGGTSIIAANGDVRWGTVGGAQYVLSSSSDVIIRLQQAVDASLLRGRFDDHDGADVSVFFEVNQIPTLLGLTVTGTGTFKDTTNTVSVVSTATVDVEFNQNAGMHGDSFRPVTWTVHMEAATASVVGDNWQPNVNGDEIQKITGDIDPNVSTDADQQWEMKRAREWSDMGWQCTVFGSTNAQIDTRLGAVTQDPTVTLTGTGFFEDVTNTMATVDGDDINFRCPSNTNGDEPSVNGCGFLVDSAVGFIYWHYAATVTAARFLSPNGGQETATEADQEFECEEAARMENMQGRCFVFNENKTLHSRVNQSNGAAAITTTGTGLFHDATNIDDVDPTDDIACSMDAGSSSGEPEVHVIFEWGPVPVAERRPRRVEALVSRPSRAGRW